jgi:hypothetical protein
MELCGWNFRMLSSARMILIRKFNTVKFSLQQTLCTVPSGQLLDLVFTVTANRSNLTIYTTQIEELISLYCNKRWVEICFIYLYDEGQSLPSNSVEE